MKLLVACVLLAAFAAGVVSARSHPSDLLIQFKAWMTKYNKSYSTTAAFDEAFHNYQATLRRVELKNLAQTKAGFIAGKFADLSPEQFRERYLNLDGKKLREALAAKDLAVTPPQPLTRTGGVLPSEFDWAMQNPSPLTYVKDQGQCGSCWAFSAVENTESQYFLAGKFPNNQIIDLSEQQVIDCAVNDAWGDDGCNGGFTQGAFEYIMKGGLDTEDSYNYVSGDSGSTGPCEFKPQNVAAKIDGWQYMVPTCNDTCDHQNSTLLMQQLVAIGPASICVVATDDWQDYSWGVLMGYCPHDAADINHGVQLTGYNSKDGFWIIRNSWGDDWGNSGYIWVGLPNECGVADIATYAVVNK